jgi:hypothetical protein
MKYLLIIFLFTSCWDGEVNGRKYRLNTPCIKSHTVIYTTPIIIGKSVMATTQTKQVCDEYGKTDTIWQNK